MLDWRSHAIDERADHPIGVFKAECGHLLMMVVALEDRPNGKACPHCSAGQAHAAHDGDEVRGYVVGECGHPVPIRLDGYVGSVCRCETT